MINTLEPVHWREAALDNRLRDCLCPVRVLLTTGPSVNPIPSTAAGSKMLWSCDSECWSSVQLFSAWVIRKEEKPGEMTRKAPSHPHRSDKHCSETQVLHWTKSKSPQADGLEALRHSWNGSPNVLQSLSTGAGAEEELRGHPKVCSSMQPSHKRSWAGRLVTVPRALLLNDNSSLFHQACVIENSGPCWYTPQSFHPHLPSARYYDMCKEQNHRRASLLPWASTPEMEQRQYR